MGRRAKNKQQNKTLKDSVHNKECDPDTSSASSNIAQVSASKSRWLANIQPTLEGLHVEQEPVPPLIHAICNADEERLMELILGGANVNEKVAFKAGEVTVTPLSLAVQYASKRKVKLLLGAGASPADDEVLLEAEHQVFIKKRVSTKVWEALLAAAVGSVSEHDTHAWAFRAIRLQRENDGFVYSLKNVMQLISVFGCDVNRPFQSCDLRSSISLDLQCQTQRDSFEVNLLASAIICGRLDVVKWMVTEKAANVNHIYKAHSIAHGSDYALPLHLASLAGVESIVSFLLESKADPFAETGDGWSAYWLAVQQEHTGCAWALSRSAASSTKKGSVESVHAHAGNQSHEPCADSTNEGYFLSKPSHQEVMRRLQEIGRRKHEIAALQGSTLDTFSPHSVEVTREQHLDAARRAESAFPGASDILQDFALRMEVGINWLESCTDHAQAAMYMKGMEAAGASFPGIKDKIKILEREGESALRKLLKEENYVAKSLTQKLGVDMNKVFPSSWNIDIYSDESVEDFIRMCRNFACKICSNCLREASPGEKFKKCASCNRSYYCSQ